MKLLVMGDYSYNDPSVEPVVFNALDHLKYEWGTQHVVTFTEPGIDQSAVKWSHDNKIPYSEYNAYQSKYPLNKYSCPPNWYLKSIVDDYQIDAFFFMFLSKVTNGKEEDKSVHRSTIRWFYDRAKRHFKDKIVFSTHENPPK